jgi:hypothetical protein
LRKSEPRLIRNDCKLCGFGQHPADEGRRRPNVLKRRTDHLGRGRSLAAHSGGLLDRRPLVISKGLPRRAGNGGVLQAIGPADLARMVRYRIRCFTRRRRHGTSRSCGAVRRALFVSRLRADCNSRRYSGPRSDGGADQHKSHGSQHNPADQVGRRRIYPDKSDLVMPRNGAARRWAGRALP